MKYLSYAPNTDRLEYEELEDIVQSYQNGNEEAGEQLIGAFWAFLQKYVRLLSYGKADITDKNMRAFIKLFMTKDKSATIYQFRRSPKAKQQLHKTIENIQEIFRHNSYHEFLHEGIVSLLTLAKRYKSKGNFFHTYVARVFHYEYHRRIIKLLELNPSNNRLPYFDEEQTDDPGEYVDGIIEETRFLVNEPLDEINENWINGLTAGDFFENLTRTQRQILKWSYLDDYTDEEIAERMGVCRATVKRRKKAAEREIGKQLEQLHILKR